ncbi:MAG: NAD-dependent epimerase/dehydratase family protein [Bacteroidota bacterium]
MKILITGAAGFIGYHLAARVCQDPTVQVIGLDSINDYYDTGLKYTRLQELGIDRAAIVAGQLVCSQTLENFRFVQQGLEDTAAIDTLFDREGFDVVINLAAQAGVRYSLVNPYPYVQANVLGFLNILEASRRNGIKHLIYASSSSVYGMNRTMPFQPSDAVDHPVSLYAATKRSNELMAHTYSHLYSLPTTGLRFFTVYGPLGRPDMAYFSFTRMILKGETIKVFNHGKMKRDFTFVDDIVNGIYGLLERPPSAAQKGDYTLRKGPDRSDAPFAIYNIGNNTPVQLLDFIRILEESLGKKANMEMLPMQPGDVEATYADIDGLHEVAGFNPSTPLEVGLPKFVEWYKSYYQS